MSRGPDRRPVEHRLHDDVPTVDAEAAAAALDPDATVLTSGFGSVGYPKAIPLALASSPRGLSLTLVASGNVGDEIDVDLVESGAVERRFSYQSSRVARDLTNRREVSFSDRNASSIGDEVQHGGMVDPDVAIVEAVAVGEDWFVPSTSLGQVPAFVEAADRLYVELNRRQPLELQALHDIYRPDAPPNRDPVPISDPGERIGTTHVSFDPEKLAGVVETDIADSTYTFRDPTDDDLAIAENLGAFLDAEMERSPVFEDAVHLQFGVGSLGNALMGELKELDFGGRDVVYFGELIQDGLLDMLDDGRLECASATSMALTDEGQQRLFENVERYAEDVVLRPADVSNHPGVIDQFGVVGVNSAIEFDIYGNVNSTHVGGKQMINGVGGSADFNRNSLVTVCALPSALKGGEVSRVVPMTFHVDHTEHDVDVFVTEQGVADVRGLSPVERAERIIENCAHPEFAPELRSYLDDVREQDNHIPHDVQRAAEWHE
ncbi:acetyl-CoA hydrolase/transferase C-terminal domain-containing protein [Halorubrum sp. CBA1229]|jgi:succinyl-CoA:acetate CoA-transferase|uniref:acetyl-CoA hydrolase/transferase C-terminal domain-containing protein n=1 Tax=Halorubrum sp. CBA1229 TaxID=1853699 RepID=UPI000F3D0274|nr:acetyl-CoA hydrolase/transferase C-terminal domain-containing protein [Halorubrum sp. CBA1229]QKY16754.1 acetyl-CoA hydrolase [Halorubrum sp. CBA1229]